MCMLSCGGVLPVDTEGSFVVDRVAEIAMGAVHHITTVANKSEDPGKCFDWRF